MAGSRPSMQSVQKTLIIGVLLGLVFGCIGGTAFGLYYAWVQAPVVYEGGSYPAEMATNYRADYINLVIDSYINRQDDAAARERLKTFDQATKIRALGERSVDFVANGQAVEAQRTIELATKLRQAEEWNSNTISAEVGKLADKYKDDNAKAQAVNTYGAALDVVPQVDSSQPSQPEAEAPSPPPAAEEEGGFSLQSVLYCFLGVAAIVVVVLLVGNWYFKASRKPPTKSDVEWEGEGPAPIKQWSGTYTLGQDNYDEFFTIETLEGDFLGESGMGILEAIPGTSPKQVVAFDVGLFDKTDITTLSRVVMSQHAFNDETIQTKIQANPQAEAVLAQPGTEFALETSALRVVATIDEMDCDASNTYFNKLTITLNVFIREGADLKIGTMDVPDQFQ